MKRRDWIKVRESWWTTPSHADLPGDTLAFGVALMWLADMDPEWQNTGIARLLDGASRPLLVSNIARRVRQDQRKCRRMLSQLVETCTLTFDADTKCYAFPNYRDHQESRDAKYKRERRESVDNRRTVAALSTTEAEAEVEAEVEAELKAPQPPAGVAPPPAKKRKKPKGSYGVEPASVDDTDTVLGWIAKAREWCGFKASALTATYANRCYVAVPMTICEASLADWKTVIGRAAVKDKADPEMGRRYLTLSTLHRPDNFTRLMERDDLD